MIRRKRAKFPHAAHLQVATLFPLYFVNLSAHFTVPKDTYDKFAPSRKKLSGAVLMFAVRQGAGRSGAGSLLPWRATRKPRLRLSTPAPASGFEFGYFTLTAALAAMLGVAVASFSTTQTLAPTSAGARTDISTKHAATAGSGRHTGGAGQITGGDRMSPTLIHNLGIRSAVTSAVGRF